MNFHSHKKKRTTADKVEGRNQPLLGADDNGGSLTALKITYKDPAQLKPRARNPRTHTKKQIQQIAASIKEFGFISPILIDGAGGVIAGHGRAEAAKLIGMSDVPTVRVDHLTPAQIRAYVIADNRLAENAGWDRELLALELQELSVDLNFDVTVTGFETAEVDLLIQDLDEGAPDEADQIPEIDRSVPAVSRPGDLWRIGNHMLLCGDALDKDSYPRLLGAQKAEMVFFKGETLAGEQPAIVDRDLFDAVQAKLNEQVHNHKKFRTKSQALLIGRIFDDRGYRMTPSHARKGAIKYRYYISSALVQGQAKQAGTVSRVPANEIEALVAKSIRNHLGQCAGSDDAAVIRNHVVRVEVRSERLIIELANGRDADAKRKRGGRPIQVPWRKRPSTRRRKILVPNSVTRQAARPIRSETRALLVASIARGRRWLNELLADANTNVERIASREGCSMRKVNMTISLAFLAPNLVKAAIDGRLPHGMGVARLCEVPAEWSRQYRMLGLTAP